jgi:hypothetical protein
MLDCFWEWPLPFQKYVHQTNTGELIDMFAGRVYGPEVHQTDAMLKMRRLLDITRAKQAGVVLTM